MTAPQSVQVEEDTEAKFTCTATTDPEEIKNLRVCRTRTMQRCRPNKLLAFVHDKMRHKLFILDRFTGKKMTKS